MHSSHINHHSNTHPSHQQQQQHCSGSNLNVADEDRVETMQQRMKPPHQHSVTTPTSSCIQATKGSRSNGATKSTPQKQSSSRGRGRYNNKGANVGNKCDSATMDDFDIMLMHEDFPHLLTIAAKVKSTHRTIAKVLDPSGISIPGHTIASPSLATKSTNAPYQPKNTLLPDEVLRAVDRMQQVLIQKKSSDKSIIPRGLYPITDSLMEDAMIVLHQEYECGKEWLTQHDESTKLVVCSSISDELSGLHGKRNRHELSLSSDNSSNTATGGPITIKYAKWQTDALMNWMIENKDQPFPDTEAIEFLVQQTGLTSSQIVNWTTNVRKRNRKATCENGKKPHHFLDFLFLVHDRETKKANTAAAEAFIGGVDVMMSERHGEYRTKYGESPRMQPSVLQCDTPTAHTMSPATNAFVFPSEPLSPPSRDHQEQYVQDKFSFSNRFMMDRGTAINAVMDDRSDLIEPFPFYTPSNDEIMFDFASSWLNDNRMMDLEMKHDFVIPQRAMQEFAPMDGHILPSVTDDSHDNFVPGRYDSLSLSLGNLIDDDDMFIEEWTSYDPINL